MWSIICITVLLSTIAVASDIECFVCNSFKDPECSDFSQGESTSLQNNYLRTCSVNSHGLHPFCRKTKTYLDDKVRVHRDCGYLKHETSDCYNQTSQGVTSEVCQCFDDFCNGAPADIIAPASGIQCYECNSFTDPACGDLFHAESSALRTQYLKTCSEENGREPFCRKTKTHFEVNNQVRVHRDCGYLLREDYDCYTQRSEDYTSEVCQCFDDFCNGATANVVAVLSLLLPFCIAGLML